MKNAIVTICNESYSALLEHWVKAIRKVSDLPLLVLCLNGFKPNLREITTVEVDPCGNPFPSSLPDHACAEKLRIFQHLPDSISEVLFLDIDVLLLNVFWQKEDYFAKSKTKLIICPDLFVGYKEKLESEFNPFDETFRMRFNPDGTHYYFNTGVFFASREAHADWFLKFLNVWNEYVKKLNAYPSIFDQNLVNYCLIKFKLDVLQIPVLNNCLRQYEHQTIRNGRLLLNKQEVNAYHLNGGDAKKKTERLLQMQRRLEDSYDST